MPWCSSPSLQLECAPKSLWLDLGSVTVLGCAFTCPFHCQEGKGLLFHGLIWMLRVGRPGPSPPQVGFMQLFQMLDSEAQGCRAHGSGALTCMGPCRCGCVQTAGEVFRDRCVLTGPGSFLEALVRAGVDSGPQGAPRRKGRHML